MGTNEAVITISAQAIKSRLEGKTELEGIVKTAMDAALTEECTWLIGDLNMKFRSAVVAICMVVDEDTKERIVKEMRSLNTLGAMLSGVPVNLGALPEQNEVDEMVGLVKHWQEAVERSKR
jgi:hypothetical protein